jgi:hypothetical protein
MQRRKFIEALAGAFASFSAPAVLAQTWGFPNYIQMGRTPGKSVTLPPVALAAGQYVLVSTKESIMVDGHEVKPGERLLITRVVTESGHKFTYL